MQDKFPADITELTLQLTRICAQYKEYRRLNHLSFEMKLNAKDGSITRDSMATAVEVIPRKPKIGGTWTVHINSKEIF